ncbi:MAG: GreA/GreB family elongation factor [Solirubrobacteraceae bacterium]
MNATANAGPVDIGSTVTYTESATADHRTIHIVASGEAEPMHGLLSDVLPVGRALLGHRAGELVRLRVPRRERHLRIDGVL